MNVRQVNPSFVPQIWPKVCKFLESALEHSGGEYTADQLKVYLVQGSQSLLVADDGEIKGAATVQFIDYPNDRVAFITSIGGRLITGNEMFSQLIEWCRLNGCTKVQGAARESVERLWRQRFGFSERYRIVEKSI
jgi:hypothetical protein